MLNKINKIYKKMTKIRKSKIFILVLLMLLLPLISPLLSSIVRINENKTNLPKSSGFWVMGPLHIKDSGGPGGDYTWAEAVLEDWCSGDGSLNTPYLLENITIDAGGSESGILIEDSNGKYFTIRNCTVMNAGTNIMANAGIKLESSSNGTVVENKCLNNIKSGIMLEYGNYNFITNNYIYNSSGVGVRLYQSDHNEVLNNNITEGTISTGIYIDSTSEFNFVSDNDVSNQRTGIEIATVAASNNTIFNNWLFNNSYTGIEISTGCNNNTIELNEIQNSSYGLRISGNGNTVYRNILINNTQNAEDWGSYNQWDNGTIGNYWYDYGGSDLDDDGIGDTPYAIAYGTNPDNFPIWDDGDDINPTIVINSPSGGSLYGTGAPTYSLNIFDLNLNKSWYTLNNSVVRYFFTPTNGINIVGIDETGWDSFSDGLMSMTFYLNDSSGHLASTSNVIIKDTSDPTISINSPSGGSLFGTDAPTYSLNIFDLNLNTSWYTLNNSAVRYFFTPTNGINIVGIDETGWDSFSDGLMSMTFYLNDSSGHLASTSNVIIKDTSDPTISINSPSGGSFFGTDAPTYSLNIFDLILNTSWYTLNNSAVRYFFTPTNGINIVVIDETGWDSFSDGLMSMTFYLNDSSGHLASTSNVITKKTTNPVITFSPNNFTVEVGYTGQSISWTATDINPYNYTIELIGTGIVVTSTPWANNTPIVYDILDGLSVGSYIYTINFTDDCGNFITDSVTFTVEDTTNPVITVSPNNFTIEVGYTGQSISWTATDINPDTYTIELQGSGIVADSIAWTSGSAINYNIPDGFSPGAYTYSITFTDESGNSISNTVTVTIDSIGDDGTPGGGIPFGNYYILFLGIGIATMLLVANKKRKK